MSVNGSKYLRNSELSFVPHRDIDGRIKVYLRPAIGSFEVGENVLDAVTDLLQRRLDRVVAQLNGMIGQYSDIPN